MGAMFIGQQFLQNVLGYSTLDAGAAILPAALLHGARRAALGQARRGARGTVHAAGRLRVRACSASSTMLSLWNEGIAYWQVGLGYAFVGAGVGFAGTPASHSLTGSVPVQRAGMASGTADLQRDLGGAIMQSIFGALLTAGYAAAVAARDRRVAGNATITTSVQNELTKSFASAEDIAAAVPAVRDPDHGRRQGVVPRRRRLGLPRRIIAVLLGAALVFFAFPRRDEERRLLESYHERTRAAAEPARARRIHARAEPRLIGIRRSRPLTDAYDRGVTGRSGPGHREVMGCNC